RQLRVRRAKSVQKIMGRDPPSPWLRARQASSSLHLARGGTRLLPAAGARRPCRRGSYRPRPQRVWLWVTGRGNVTARIVSSRAGRPRSDVLELLGIRALCASGTVELSQGRIVSEKRLQLRGLR